jgi:hypothetical protein
MTATRRSASISPKSTMPLCRPGYRPATRRWQAGSSELDVAAQFKVFALKIKRDTKARVSPAQRRFIEAVRQADGVAEVGRGLDDLLKILEGWEPLRGGG